MKLNSGNNSIMRNMPGASRNASAPMSACRSRTSDVTDSLMKNCSKRARVSAMNGVGATALVVFVGFGRCSWNTAYAFIVSMSARERSSQSSAAVSAANTASSDGSRRVVRRLATES